MVSAGALEAQMADRYPYPGLGALSPGTEFELAAELARHVGQVLRAELGSQLVLFDGKGQEGVVTLIEVQKRRFRARLDELRPCLRRPRRWLELAFSPPKGQRAEVLIEQAAAYGVRVFQPVHFARTPKARRWTRVPSRLHRITLAVAGQCGLDVLPELRAPLSFDEYLAQRITDFGGERWIAEPDSGPRPCAVRAEAPPALVVIGPEGDFSPEERSALRRAGCHSLDLGPFVLRIEAAAIAAASILLMQPPEAR